MPFSYTSSLTKKELKEIAEKVYKKCELESLKFLLLFYLNLRLMKKI